MNEIPEKRMGCKQIVKLTSDLLTFASGVGIMNSSSRDACDPGNIFPLLSLYHTDAGAVRKDRPGAVFLLSLPDYCFFIFIEKQ